MKQEAETAVLQHHLSQFVLVGRHRDWNLVTELQTENDRHLGRFSMPIQHSSRSPLSMRAILRYCVQENHGERPAHFAAESWLHLLQKRLDLSRPGPS